MSFDLSVFSQTYTESRQKFLAAAQSTGLTVTSYTHPLKGSEGEELALDVAWQGPRDLGQAKHIALFSSAVHGVEGFCGSAIQLHALRDASWRNGLTTADDDVAAGVAANVAAGVAANIGVLYLHAVNIEAGSAGGSLPGSHNVVPLILDGSHSLCGQIECGAEA